MPELPEVETTRRGNAPHLIGRRVTGVLLRPGYRPEPQVRKLPLATYTLVGVLEPVYKETYLGTAEVRNTFRIPKIGVIAGSYITDGKITRNAEIRLLRDNVVIFEGKIASLKRFKEDASEVARGYECGIGIQNFNDVKVGDQIEAFVTEKVMADVGA